MTSVRRRDVVKKAPDFSGVFFVFAPILILGVWPKYQILEFFRAEVYYLSFDTPSISSGGYAGLLCYFIDLRKRSEDVVIFTTEVELFPDDKANLSGRFFLAVPILV